MISISEKGLKLIEVVAPSSEAIYAAITRRYGASKLAELQDMLQRAGGKPGGSAEVGRRRLDWSERKFA